MSRKRHFFQGWRRRKAFMSVLHHYCAIKSTVGNPQAIDYSRCCSESEGAQFKDDKGVIFKFIEFIADVEHTAKSILTEAEYTYFEDARNDRLDYIVTSEDQLKVQQKLGAAFLERGIAPVRRYFSDYKV